MKGIIIQKKIAWRTNKFGSPASEQRSRNFKNLRMGWLTGLEPATTGTTIQYSNQLSYSHRKIKLGLIKKNYLSKMRLPHEPGIKSAAFSGYAAMKASLSETIKTEKPIVRPSKGFPIPKSYQGILIKV
jgi:hypothetical protein